MTFSHKPSDENSIESDDENDEEMSPTPLQVTETGNDDGDDDPPAAGAAMILEADEESKYGLTLSLAPTAEPQHRAKPELVTA